MYYHRPHRSELTNIFHEHPSYKLANNLGLVKLSVLSNSFIGSWKAETILVITVNEKMLAQ